MCVLVFQAGFLSVVQSDEPTDSPSPRGVIVKTEGQVYVINAAGEKKPVAGNKYAVNSNETVVTDKDSKAVLRLDDGVVSVLDEKSSLRVERTGWLSQLGGKVYYVFRKILGQEKPRKITTNFATIGIRGTTFIIDVGDKNQFVALQEGQLNIKSPAEDFEIHKLRLVENEYSDFKETEKALNSEYKEYKKKIDKEFIEYKKEFDLHRNKVVSFTGMRVDETELNKEWLSSFSEFADFSREYIREFRAFEKAEGGKIE